MRLPTGRGRHRERWRPRLPNHHDHGGTAIDAITIHIDERGNITTLDDAEDEFTGDLDDEHIDVLVPFIYNRAPDHGLGSNIDYRLNDLDYYHVDDDDAHDDCYSKDDVEAAIDQLRSTIQGY